MKRRLATAIRIGFATTAAMLAVLLAGCSALWPENTSTRKRLAVFPDAPAPVQHPVTIRWDDNQIPFIDAETDHDLAFALGMVHAHLRLGQMSLLKRVAQGRLSEMFGPFTVDIDHALRILDYGRAAPEIERRLPDETRAWLDAFVAGLNHYQDNTDRLPPELALLGIEPEPWTVQDVLTIGRLAGTDVNWLVWFGLLEERLNGNWEHVWTRSLKAGTNGAESFSVDSRRAALSSLLRGYSKSGSNSVVVGPQLSATGAPLIANDPHLGLSQPNFWLLVGMKSPSFHAVGMMAPGLPFIAIGRNPDIAWGGTNMRAASSELYNVALGPDAEIESRTETIGVRLWFDREVTIRNSRYGPIISDSPLIPKRPGEMLAIRWTGHQATDEITALLNANRARSVEEFRAAFKGYAVPGQNMLVADRAGNIGHVLAVRQPVRPNGPGVDVVKDPTDPRWRWYGYRDATELPMAFNPPQGFIASSNNRPTHTDTPISFFFSPDERVKRLQHLIGSAGTGGIDVAALQRLQRDVISSAALDLRTRLLAAIDEAGVDDTAPDLVTALRAWDGAYDADSHGPVAFETLLYHVVHGVYGTGPDDELPPMVERWSQITTFLADDLAALPAARRAELLRTALSAAGDDAARFPTWGDMHRLRVAHALGMLPVVGRFFTYMDLPAGGSRETVMKRAHGWCVTVTSPDTARRRAMFRTCPIRTPTSLSCLAVRTAGWAARTCSTRSTCGERADISACR